VSLWGDEGWMEQRMENISPCVGCRQSAPARELHRAWGKREGAGRCKDRLKRCGSGRAHWGKVSSARLSASCLAASWGVGHEVAVRRTWWRSLGSGVVGRAGAVGRVALLLLPGRLRRARHWKRAVKRWLCAEESMELCDREDLGLGAALSWALFLRAVVRRLRALGQVCAALSILAFPL